MYSSSPFRIGQDDFLTALFLSSWKEIDLDLEQNQHTFFNCRFEFWASLTEHNWYCIVSSKDKF